MVSKLRKPDFLIKEIEDLYAQENWYKLKLYLDKLQNEIGLNPTNNNGSTSSIISPTPTTSTDGWSFFQDATYTQASPFNVSGGVRTLIPNDNAGLLSGTFYGNPEALTWWDPASSTFFPSRLGEFYTLRMNMFLKSSINNTTVTFDVDIGTPNAVYQRDFEITRGAGIDTKISEVIPVGASNAPVANGFKFYITSQNPITIHSINLIALRVGDFE